MKKISVIIPAYNCEKYISRCLDSILKQHYKNLEVVVVNDGSTDGTLQILKDYSLADSRIKIVNQENMGVSHARNNGVKMCNGDYVHFVDADDLVVDGIYEYTNSLFTEYDIDLLRINYQLDFDGKLKENAEIKYDKLFDNSEIKDIVIPQILDEKIKGYVWQIILKKEMFSEFDASLCILEDEKLYLDILPKMEKVYFSSRTYYLYNSSNTQSATKSKEKYEKMMTNMLLANRKIKESLINNHIDTKSNLSILDSRMAHSFSNYLELLYKNFKSFKSAKKLFIKVRNGKNLKTIFDNLDYSRLSKKHKLTTFCTMNNLYLLLHIIYFVKVKLK